MSWYGNQLSTSRQLDALVEQKPTFSELLCYADFIQHLKAFNVKLLDYLSNSTELPKEMITYLAVPPKESDSEDRKYKLPLLALESVESETTCIINWFFKVDPEQKVQNLLVLYRTLLSEKEILPLLAGYFFRVNECLLRCKSR